LRERERIIKEMKNEKNAQFEATRVPTIAFLLATFKIFQRGSAPNMNDFVP
jgi:hypothetical protein